MPLEDVAHDDAQAVRRDADRVRIAVARAPGGRPDVRAGDVTELRERVDECERDGTLGGRTGDRVRDPREEGDEACVRLRHEEERDVPCRGVHCRQRDDAADEADNEWGCDVEEPFASFVGMTGDAEGDEGGEDPWRGAE